MRKWQKYLLSTILLSFILIFNGNAQQKHLMGPAAKNYKLYKDPDRHATVLTNRKGGPYGIAAKNRKPMEPGNVLHIRKSKKYKRMGPKAKNSGF